MDDHSVDDCASTQGTAAWTSSNQFVEGAPDMLKLRDLAVNFFALALRLRSDIAAIRPRIGSEREEPRNLAEGKS